MAISELELYFNEAANAENDVQHEVQQSLNVIPLEKYGLCSKTEENDETVKM